MLFNCESGEGIYRLSSYSSENKTNRYEKNSVSPKRICIQHPYLVRLSMSYSIMLFSTHGLDNITFETDIGLFEILKISHGAGGWLDGSVGGWVHRMLKVYLNSLNFQTYCILFSGLQI